MIFRQLLLGGCHGLYHRISLPSACRLEAGALVRQKFFGLPDHLVAHIVPEHPDVCLLIGETELVRHPVIGVGAA